MSEEEHNHEIKNPCTSEHGFLTPLLHHFDTTVAFPLPKLISFWSTSGAKDSAPIMRIDSGFCLRQPHSPVYLLYHPRAFCVIQLPNTVQSENKWRNGEETKGQIICLQVYVK